MNNNFNFIRLLASIQVAVTHMAVHFEIENALLRILAPFPGVPIFFFVSGYLIYGSYERSRKSSSVYRDFIIKRFLRIYPALWLCFFISVSLAWISGYFASVSFSAADFFLWVIAQNTFVQFYNPEFMRGYGVGVLNGSLWTISVELQFYILTPLVFLLLNHANRYFITCLLLVFVAANMLNSVLIGGGSVFIKIFFVSFAPWLYMFLLGFLAAKCDLIAGTLRRVNFFLPLFLFLASYFLLRGFNWGNAINPVSFVLLAMLVLKAAYTLPALSRRVLGKADISYGVYIYHMPIVNFLIYNGVSGVAGFCIALVVTIIFSVCSWRFLEERVLSLK